MSDFQLDTTNLAFRKIALDANGLPNDVSGDQKFRYQLSTIEIGDSIEMLFTVSFIQPNESLAKGIQTKIMANREKLAYALKEDNLSQINSLFQISRERLIDGAAGKSNPNVIIPST